MRRNTVKIVLASAIMLAGVVVATTTAKADTTTCGGTGANTTVTGALADGATWKIECPAGGWNGTLFLYSHGYVVPGSRNPAQDVGDPVTAAWLLSHGFALAGSSYATTGWALQAAFQDQIGTLDTFTASFGAPAQTIAWGHSLGGIITAGLVQKFPGRFTAALPMCGVLAGGVATWNSGLDAAFAFQQLIDPQVQIVRIANPFANLQQAEQASAAAQQTPQGRARLALVAALTDAPGWFSPQSPEPAATDYVTQEQNQYLWGTQVTFPFAFALRDDLEAKAGGNPSWNTGVNYLTQLGKSADLAEVRALYAAAGLSLDGDLFKLNAAPRIAADPAAVQYLSDNIAFNGQLSIPVLTMHTTGDGLVINQNEQAYSSVVTRAGSSDMLRQLFVHRAGHCAFTPAETITAVQTLLSRVQTGSWAVPAPDGMNALAAALGPTYNGFGATQVAPAFIDFQPTLYPRSYDLFRL